MADPKVAPDPATTEWVPIWNPVGQGPVGPTGPQGPPGTPGAAAAHHVTHEPGGADAIVGAAWVALANTFSQNQIFRKAFPALRFLHEPGSVNARAWQFYTRGSTMELEATLDDGSTVTVPLIVSRAGALAISGTISERGRAVPMGNWTPYTPTWAATGGGVSLGNGSIQALYTRIGNTVFFRIRLNTGSTTAFGSGMWSFTVPLPFQDHPAGSTWLYDGVGGQTYIGATVMGDFFGGQSPSVTAMINIGNPGGNAAVLSATVPIAWAARVPSYLFIQGSYETYAG